MKFFYFLFFIFSKFFYFFKSVFEILIFFMKSLILFVYNVVSSMLGSGKMHYFWLNDIFMATKETSASKGQSHVESFLKSAIIFSFIFLLFAIMFILNFLSPEGTFTSIVVIYLKLYLSISILFYSMLVFVNILTLLGFVYSGGDKSDVNNSIANEGIMNYMVFLVFVLLVLFVVFWLLGGGFFCF